MTNRREFLVKTGAFAAGSVLLPLWSCNETNNVMKKIGVQLYTFRDAMMENASGTLEKIAALGFKEIETAKSDKGLYYGLGPTGMSKRCEELGMTLRSGHVHIDENWNKTVEEAAESGQEYVICSTMPTDGQTVDNYKRVADAFNKAGEDCKKMGLKFGYHNHGYEFDTIDGKILYDILLRGTNPDLVHMELDLGWVVTAGKDPLDYFNRFPGRFPLWHLKDMDMVKKHSTEFGKGDLDIRSMLLHQKESGLEYFFVEQEEYANNPFDSMKENMDYLSKING